MENNLQSQGTCAHGEEFGEHMQCLFAAKALDQRLKVDGHERLFGAQNLLNAAHRVELAVNQLIYHPSSHQKHKLE